MPLLVTLIVAVPVVAGFITSRRRRRLDRWHFAAFVGFSGGVAAVAATILWLASARNLSPAWQGVTFVSGIVGIISSLVAFFAGLFTGGVPRFALVSFGIAMGLIYFLGAFSNFGA
ncbi:MAG: hypothetical protein ACLPHI_05800 [Terriglobales bacterium]